MRTLHETDRPSATAQAVTLYRALEHRRPAGERIVDDRYAQLFLDAATRRLLTPLAWTRPLRDRAARFEVVGVAPYVLCRHAFIDEHLAAADFEQVVILGAGYDSRAYRFAGLLGGRAVFEVDLPPLSRRKAAIVAAHEAQFASGSIVRVEIDFRTQQLTDRLLQRGFAAGRRTFVVWEGVAPYLSAEAVDGTLDALRSLCAPGSTLAMDLWDTTGGTGPLAPARRLAARAIALIGEPVTFGVLASAAPALLGRHGFQVADLAEAGALSRRYATAGRRCVESLYVVAATIR